MHLGHRFFCGTRRLRPPHDQRGAVLDVVKALAALDPAGFGLDDACAQLESSTYVIADEVSTRLATHEDHERHICVIHEDGHEVTRVPVDWAVSKASAPRSKKLS